MIEINIYRDGSVWHGARWVDGEWDGCDPLPVDDSATESEARDAALTMPLVAAGQRVVARVADVDTSR